MAPATRALSDRELQVVHFLFSGYSSKQTAVELGISADTVRQHLYRVYRRAGVPRQQYNNASLQLVAMAWKASNYSRCEDVNDRNAWLRNALMSGLLKHMEKRAIEST